jgi:hypothetical protein
MTFPPGREEVGAALETVHTFVNKNLPIIRSSISICIAAYWYVLFRRTRPFFRFRDIATIPKDDFKRRHQLKGILTSASGSRMTFFHRTIVDRIMSPDYQVVLEQDSSKAEKALHQSIDIRLFGVNVMHPVGIAWTTAALRHKAVSISLLYLDEASCPSSEDSSRPSICTIVKGRLDGGWFKSDIGSEILSRGLGTVRTEEPGAFASTDLKDIRALTKRLDLYSKLEADAKRRRKGIWEEHENGPRPLNTSWLSQAWRWFRYR